MNNSSSWNCFSWKRGNTESEGDRKKHQKGSVPDEQFANLLGGELH